MTATCRVCHAEIAQRFVGATLVWGHTTNPRNEHHYPAPPRDVLRGESVEPDPPRSTGLSAEHATGTRP